MAIEDAAGLVLLAMGAGPMLLSRPAHCKVIEPYADALGRSGALPQTAWPRTAAGYRGIRTWSRTSR